MDPKSRPTFDELVVQLEQMLQSFGKGLNNNSISSTGSPSAAANDRPTISVTGRPDVDAQHPAPLLDDPVLLAKNTCHNNEKTRLRLMKSMSRFDDDVYLVPGSSPSEKARCHYVQGHAKDKANRSVSSIILQTPGWAHPSGCQRNNLRV